MAPRGRTLTQPADEYPSQKLTDDKSAGLGVTLCGGSGWGTLGWQWRLTEENEPGWGRSLRWEGAGQRGPPGTLSLGEVYELRETLASLQHTRGLSRS